MAFAAEIIQGIKLDSCVGIHLISGKDITTELSTSILVKLSKDYNRRI